MNQYSMLKLKKVDGLDMDKVIKAFDNDQAYFDALDRFIDDSKRYLRDYTPSVVIYSDDMREDFLRAVEQTQAALISIGLFRPASTLLELTEAAASGNEKALDDGLLFFFSEMDIMAKYIAAAQGPDIIEEPVLQKSVILAVDDKPELLAAIVDMLKDRYRVMSVTSGAAAMKVIEKHTPDLFLLDIEMPHMDGYALAALIRDREQFSKTPIVFLTAKGTREDVITAVAFGGNDYIIKPVRKELLLRKVEQYLVPVFTD